MKCDRCENDATTHEVMIKAGKRHERHLCEACAKAEGMAAGRPHIPITQLLNQFITSQVQGAQSVVPGQVVAGAGSAGTCGCCGTTLTQFRQTGLLGCPDCYAAFEAQLSPLLQRAHEGGTHHVGKRPMRLRAAGPARPIAPSSVASSLPVAATSSAAEPPAERVADELERLRQRLAKAIAAERYEEAAALRDEMRKLEQPAQPTTARRATKTPRPPRPDGGKGTTP